MAVHWLVYICAIFTIGRMPNQRICRNRIFATQVRQSRRLRNRYQIYRSRVRHQARYRMENRMRYNSLEKVEGS